MLKRVVGFISKIKCFLKKNQAKTTNKLQKARDEVLQAEYLISKHPNAVTGKDLDELCPLEHKFVDGMYIRKITMPKGTLISSKIHKWEHPYFITKGRVSVLTEDGITHLEAPYSGITGRGTKRVIYVHEDTEWTTVHATESKDLKEIEEQIIAKNFDNFPLGEEQISSFHKKMLQGEKGGTRCLEEC